MKLTELEPEFLRRESDSSSKFVSDINLADGIMFLCPKCGQHSIICWRPRVPDNIDPKPGRWEFLGKGFDDLTLTAGSSSILIGGCKAHFWIKNGQIIW